MHECCICAVSSWPPIGCWLRISGLHSHGSRLILMFSRKINLKVALAAGFPLVVASGLSCLPAKASGVTCTYDGSTWLVTASVAACGNMVVADKSVDSSTFGVTGYTFTSGDLVALADVGLPVNKEYSFIFTPVTQNLTGTGSFSYGITITNPSNTFLNAFARVDGSNASGDTYTNTLTSAQLVGSSVTGPSAANGPNLVFNPVNGVTATTFLNSWSVTQGSIASLGNGFRQQDVPGPLPLLGAGAAFGFSRKLRKRIKQAA